MHFILYLICLVLKIDSNFFLFADMLAELARREKAANIMPDPDIDVYMKVRYNLHLFSR